MIVIRVGRVLDKIPQTLAEATELGWSQAQFDELVKKSRSQ